MNCFEVIVPQLGVNDKEVTIVEWRAAPGDAVQRGQVLGTVETTKAAFELEAEQEGYFYPLADAGAWVTPCTATGSCGMRAPCAASISAMRSARS